MRTTQTTCKFSIKTEESKIYIKYKNKKNNKNNQVENIKFVYKQH